ncbi:MAG: glycosyltransferase [Acidimicrobiia bacterium]
MIRRVAYLSMHTSPLLQPGTGDAGGMNVYIDELAQTMASRGVKVEVFTRSDRPDLPTLVKVADGYRVAHVEAGPARQLPVTRLPRHVLAFARAVADRMEDADPPFDLVHSHYWLSGWAGLVIKRTRGIPLANSFHTLGRIKELTKRRGEPPESLLRIAAEQEVIEGSDCLVASTPAEGEDLMEHYGADPHRLCISPPGVDHEVFHPGPQAGARRALGLGDGPLVLFVGRVQALKGVDVAIEAFAVVRDKHPEARMLVVGGPSGPEGEEEQSGLQARAAALELGEAVRFLPPIPHGRLADVYRAADVLVFPSRSESFGLVAAEAQACGLPVVASRVGGLVYAVDHVSSGFLISGWRPDDYAEAMVELLDDPVLAAEMSRAAVDHAERFSWDATADRFLELYAGVLGRG